MMEENNRKGPGVFYAVTGVATLVVAIIGATFAYFSATDTDDSTIQGSTAAAGGIELNVSAVTATGTNLIPLNVTIGEGTSDSVAQLSSALKATNTCVDNNGNNVCQIYKIEVSNLSTTSTVTVRGYLTLTGTKTTNLKWQLLDENYATSGAAPDYATITAQGTANAPITVGGNSIATVGGSVGTGKELSSNVMTASSNNTYYVMVWLEETGDAQETDDAAGTFTGSVTFNAVDANGNSTGVTASFSS